MGLKEWVTKVPICIPEKEETIERCLIDIEKQGMAGVHLTTTAEGILPKFYEQYGFRKLLIIKRCTRYRRSVHNTSFDGD